MYVHMHAHSSADYFGEEEDEDDDNEGRGSGWNIFKFKSYYVREKTLEMSPICAFTKTTCFASLHQFQVPSF